MLFYDSLVTGILVPAQNLLLRDTHNGVFMCYDGSRKASVQDKQEEYYSCVNGQTAKHILQPFS